MTFGMYNEHMRVTDNNDFSEHVLAHTLKKKTISPIPY